MFLFFLFLSKASSIPFTFLPSFKSTTSQKSLSAIAYISTKSSVLVFGGKDVTDYSSELSIFNLTQGEWTVLSNTYPFPSGRHSMAYMLSSNEEYFYIFGGLTFSGISNELWRLSTLTFKWEKLEYNGNVPKLFGMSFTKVPYLNYDILYIYSGESTAFTDENLYKYRTFRFNSSDLSFSQVKLNSIGGLVYSFMTFANQSLFIVGGYSISGNSVIYNKSVFRIPINTFNVSRFDLSDLLCDRIYTTGFLHNSQVFIFNSVDESYNLQGSQVLDLTRFSVRNIEVNLSYYFPAVTAYNNTVFIFGGTDFSAFKNQLFSFDVLKNEIITLSEDFIAPAPRHSSALVNIEEKIYLFGGFTGTGYLNDVWVFDQVSATWANLIDSDDSVFLKIPEPRSEFGYTSEGPRLFVFSGKGANFYSDLYEYNCITNLWNVLDSNSAVRPLPRAGACLVYYNSSIYVYGGYDLSHTSNELWKFDLLDSQYSLISAGEYSGKQTYCSVDKDSSTIHIVSTDTSKSVKSIMHYNIKTQTWTSSKTPIRSSNSADYILENYLISFGGTSLNSHLKKSITVLNMSSLDCSTFLISNSLYLSSVIHFSDSLFLFGGVSFHGNFIQGQLSSNALVKIPTKDLFNTTFCSAGTYLNPENPAECLKCNSGTYSSSINSKVCLPCPKGSYNQIKAASSKQQCLPCEAGSWNNQTGQSFCRDCPSNFYCPYGSSYPSEYKIIGIDSTSQPSIYVQETAVYNYYSTLVIALCCSVFSVGIILLFLLTKARQKLYLADIYSNLHNHKLLVPMYVKKTNIGGFCSLIFFIVSFSFILITVLRYNLVNIQEIRSLVPLVTVSQSFSADFYFEVNLFYYGGDCEDHGACVSTSSITTKGIQVLTKSCSKSDQTCTIKLKCLNCTVEPSSSILLDFHEEFSFCSYISVNMSSTTSIPNKYSSAVVYTASDSSTYFKGINPSVFTFSLIPTLFESSTMSSSGFHISTDSSVVIGSQYSASKPFYGSGVGVKIVLEISNTCLYISRTEVTTQVELFSALIGTVFGLMSSIGGLMMFLEKYYENISSWLYHKNLLRYYNRRVRRIMAMIYQEPGLSKNYGTRSFPFSPKDLHSETILEDQSLYKSMTNKDLE